MALATFSHALPNPGNGERKLAVSGNAVDYVTTKAGPHTVDFKSVNAPYYLRIY